jgi:hypothetical protein
MANYSIEFKLLLPRAKLLRIDVLPFLFLYAILAYALYEYYDNAIYNLYLRLTIIATCFLQSTPPPYTGLTYIFGHWSKKSQSFIQYRSLSGPLVNNLDNASHVLIREER